jgi:hypothetical protein
LLLFSNEKWLSLGSASCSTLSKSSLSMKHFEFKFYTNILTPMLMWICNYETGEAIGDGVQMQTATTCMGSFWQENYGESLWQKMLRRCTAHYDNSWKDAVQGTRWVIPKKSSGVLHFLLKRSFDQDNMFTYATCGE